MKKRVVPFETVETFLETLQIIFYNSPRKPDYAGLREIFMQDSFEVECEEPKEDNEAKGE